MATQNKKDSRLAILGWATLFVVVVGVATTAGVLSVRKRNQQEIDELIKAIKDPTSNDSLEGGGEKGTSDDLYASGVWNPRTYLVQSGISKPTMDIATAQKYARQIYDAKGYGLLPDKETQAVAAIQKARNRSDVAKIADAFQGLYKEPLSLYLQSFMDNQKTYFSDKKDYSAEILSIIKRLPK